MSWTRIVLLAAAATLAASSVTAETRLEVLVQAKGEHHPGTVLVEAVPAPPKGATAEAHEVAMANGRGEIALTLAHPGTWRLSASAPEFWCPISKVEVAAEAQEPEPVQLVLWPAVYASAAFRFPEGAEATDEVLLILNRVSDSAVEAPDSAKLRCPITDTRVAGCNLPAGTWHMRIKVASYIPQFRWGLELEVGNPIDLGEIILERGTSLLGRVRTCDGTALSPQAWVALRPLSHRNPRSRSPFMLREERLEELKEEIENRTQKVSVNEWGYFHLDAVSPGTYRLTASQPGYTPATLDQLLIESAQDLELTEPLVLQEALQITVVVTPSQDFEGQPWAVEAFRLSNAEEPQVIIEGQTARGEWVSPPLPAGAYFITIEDSRSNNMASKSIILVEDQMVWIELKHVTISGKVVMGDEPLATSLHFNSLFLEVKTESDNDGLFELMLPKPGTWRIDVQNELTNIDHREISEVEIGPGHTEELVIEIPDTRVYGEVVYEDGRPASSAQVFLREKYTEKRKQSLYSYEDEASDNGRFEIRGLSPATYRVEAVEGTLHSMVETVRIAEAEEATQLDLVLHDYWLLEGKLVSESEPVPNAVIFAVPFTEQGAKADTDVQLRSEINGSFTIVLPGITKSVNLVVLAPGFTFYTTWVTRRHPPSTNMLELSLTTGGGTLELPKEAGPELLVVGMTATSVSHLIQWAFMNGMPIEQPGWKVNSIPAMPAATYLYCDMSMEETNLVVSGVAVPSPYRCSEGRLREGGVLVFDAPRSMAAQDP